MSIKYTPEAAKMKEALLRKYRRQSFKIKTLLTDSEEKITTSPASEEDETQIVIAIINGKVVRVTAYIKKSKDTITCGDRVIKTGIFLTFIYAINTVYQRIEVIGIYNS